MDDAKLAAVGLTEEKLASLPPHILADVNELLRRARMRKLYDFFPYPKQYEFYAAGAKFRERALFGGNQVGKSWGAANEVAFHLTGYYPWWWPGVRYEKPPLIWTGSKSNETSREVIQAALFGTEIADTKHPDFGTGAILGERIIKITTRMAGIKDVIDQAFIGWGWPHPVAYSRVMLKGYEQGWTSFAGKKVNFIWLDEEPPPNDSDQSKIYSESLTRTMAAKSGRLIITFTPQNGMTPIVRGYMEPQSDTTEKFYTMLTIYDTIGGTWPEGSPFDGTEWKNWKGHNTADTIEAKIKSWPKHERKTRAYAVPMAGTGAVFPIDEDEIRCAPFEIPRHFARINGIDFGINEDHPFGLVCLAHDRDKDVVYVYHAHKKSDQTPAMQAPAIKKLGKWIPVAWPHDGVGRERKGGEPIMQAYLDEEVAMLPFSARYKDDDGGPQPVEPAVMDMIERMETGRFKVFTTCDDWFQEMRTFHRKDGVIVKQLKDDLMKATVYAMMMKRYAHPEPVPDHARRRRPSAPQMWGTAA